MATKAKHFTAPRNNKPDMPAQAWATYVRKTVEAAGVSVAHLPSGAIRLRHGLCDIVAADWGVVDRRDLRDLMLEIKPP